MDSVSSSNVVPYGSNTIRANHKVMSWYDELRNDRNSDNSSGNVITYNFDIYNDTGSSHLYIFYVKWRYFGEVGSEGGTS
jgi:hypothetical protein